MRLTLRSFVFLDAISLVLLGMQVWYIAEHYGEISLLSEKVRATLMFPMFFLVLFGAIGLFLQKKYGYLLYYIQFPFRLYLLVFSIGFITLIPEAFSVFDDIWFEVLLKCCYVAEFIRLYLTIRIHLNQLKQ